MKTGLLKWKPDYEGASVEYGKAGKFDVTHMHMKICYVVSATLICIVFIWHF